MSDQAEKQHSRKFAKEVARKESLKLKERRKAGKGIWFGLGMFGIIGWSVVVPTLLGVVLGMYIDRKAQGEHSWTLALLVVGLFLGCLNAWHWVVKEDKKIQNDNDE